MWTEGETDKTEQKQYKGHCQSHKVQSIAQLKKVDNKYLVRYSMCYRELSNLDRSRAHIVHDIGVGISHNAEGFLPASVLDGGTETTMTFSGPSCQTHCSDHAKMWCCSSWHSQFALFHSVEMLVGISHTPGSQRSKSSAEARRGVEIRGVTLLNVETLRKFVLLKLSIGQTLICSGVFSLGIHLVWINDNKGLCTVLALTLSVLQFCKMFNPNNKSLLPCPGFGSTVVLAE